MNGRAKTRKKSPKIHTKQFELHIVEGDGKLIIEPSDSRAYKHYKRWAYQNLSKRNMYHDSTAECYVIDLEKGDKTISGDDILFALKRDFTVLGYLPFEEF